MNENDYQETPREASNIPKEVIMSVPNKTMQIIDGHASETGKKLNDVRKLAFEFAEAAISNDMDRLNEIGAIFNPHLDIKNPQMHPFDQLYQNRAVNVKKGLQRLIELGHNSVNLHVSDVPLSQALHDIINNGDDIAKWKIGTARFEDGKVVDCVLHPRPNQKIVVGKESYIIFKEG